MKMIHRLLAVGVGMAAAFTAYRLIKVNQPEEDEETEIFMPQENAKELEEERAQGRVWSGSPSPNPNPVTLGSQEAPRDEDGKFDPTRIASPEDFGDWDDLGCQG